MSAPHSADELQRIYERRFSGLHEYRDAVWRVLVDEYFAQWIPARGAVLDLGCGHCEFINNVRAETRFGIDLNPESLQRAATGVQILLQSCAEPWAMADDSLDVVFTSNFFEHLYTKHDLREALLQAWRCLKPGGRIIAMGPNIRYLAGEYWDFYDHYLALTELSLGEVMTRNRLHAGETDSAISAVHDGARPPASIVDAAFVFEDEVCVAALWEAVSGYGEKVKRRNLKSKAPPDDVLGT